jgi:molecular chaperone HtpG
MSKGTLEIHSENILPIIKKWLYSDKDVFVRELVSNSCDAIYKVKVLRDQGTLATTDEELRIDISVDKEARMLTFRDTGIGMDAEEVQKYIAQIAFSSAEEFVSKYTSNRESDQIIGHFGLGFYSAFMVADKVTVDTLSYKEGAAPVLWSCDGSREYEITEGTRTRRGTTITLFIGEDSNEYLEHETIKRILTHYCSFLPYPIFLQDERINPTEPLWIKSPADCTKEDYLAFYRALYPMEEEPLFWVHLNVDYPFHLKGILYFPKIRRHMDLSKHSVKLYCNRVFVSDNCKDVIPEYLMMLRGVIDSPDIPLNVSRSYLQMDRTVRQLASHISKKVSDSLGTLYRTERDQYIAMWEDISLVVKLGALEDEKFYERVKDVVIWKTIAGEWMTVADYLEAHSTATHNKVLYTSETDHFSPVVDLYLQRNIPVICAGAAIDSYLIQFLERKLSPVSFQRIDSELPEQLIDKEREKVLLDADGRTEAAKLAELVGNCLDKDDVEVVAKSLVADALPGFITMDEQQRRMREYMQRLNPEESGMFDQLGGKRTFVVNTNHPLMKAIEGLQQREPQLAKELVKQVYELALLSQRELEPSSLKTFVQRSTQVLEQMAVKLTQSSNQHVE